MAPREVIHNFPDSLINYDFESSVSGGVTFHDGATAMNAMVEDGDDNMTDDDDGPGFHALIQPLLTGATMGASNSDEGMALESNEANVANHQLTVVHDSELNGVGTSFAAWHGLPPAVSPNRSIHRETVPVPVDLGLSATDPLSIDASEITLESWNYTGLLHHTHQEYNLLPSSKLTDGRENRAVHLLYEPARSVILNGSLVPSNEDVSMSSPTDFLTSPDISPHASPRMQGENKMKLLKVEDPSFSRLDLKTNNPMVLSSNLCDDETQSSSIPEMDTTQESTNEESDFSLIESPPRGHGYRVSMTTNPVQNRSMLPTLNDSFASHDHLSNASHDNEYTQGEEVDISPMRRSILRAIEIPPISDDILLRNSNARPDSNLINENSAISTPVYSGRRVSIDGASSSSSGSQRSLQWNSAFELDSSSSASPYATPEKLTDPRCNAHNTSCCIHQHANVDTQRNMKNLYFDSHVTTVADLKNYAERGLIVLVLQALNTPRLKTLGTRMLADYAKMPQRRVAVASNRRILDFCRSIMVELPSSEEMGIEWPAREYAVETIRSLTATEESDAYLMKCPNLIQALALVSCGGPFLERANTSGASLSKWQASHINEYGNIINHPSGHRSNVSYQSRPSSLNTLSSVATNSRMGLVSGKARLHACIALMNLSCGKTNKVEIASQSEVLAAMRDVMVSDADEFSPSTSSPSTLSSTVTTPSQVNEEARLKAVTCIKNLSNADANDAALLGMRGLVEALGYAAIRSCSEITGATVCTTNACLALMNLSIAKGNKHEVFRTPGIMEALMAVVIRTSSKKSDGVEGKNPHNAEARIKACSALSNLAIGYDNKVPMFEYPGFVKSILHVIDTDEGEARTKACSILWSFAAEMKNQVPVVRRGDILPTLVRIADEDQSTEARFKCVAALTLLAESLENAVPLLESGAIHPLMDILHEAGPDPTQWKGQTASWCVGFFMNIAQSDEAVSTLREAGVVEILAPLLSLDHYQSLKAAMAITFVCRYDEDYATYDLLRKTENVIPKIISLLSNTLSGRGGTGYKYGVFTLRSSVGCIASLACGPEFMKERIAISPVFENLLQVVSDFCVNGGTPGAIVGGGRDDSLSATFAIRALHSLTAYLVPISGNLSLHFGSKMVDDLIEAFESFVKCSNPFIKNETRLLAADAKRRIQSPQSSAMHTNGSISLADGFCMFPSCLHDSVDDANFLVDETYAPVRTFLLTNNHTGQRFVVPTDPSGGRAFYDDRRWCYRRGRFCNEGETPDPNYQWTEELEAQYAFEISRNRPSVSVFPPNSRDRKI